MVSGGITAGRQLGRFGHKASTASLLIQASTAYNEDVGVTSPLLPTENCALQHPICSSNSRTSRANMWRQWLSTPRTLAVPARRNIHDPTCVAAPSCSRPRVQRVPRPHATYHSRAEPELANLTIHPYTNLLLHDMGPELAMTAPIRASGSEWRTPPLWASSFGVRDRHTRFLHDGAPEVWRKRVLCIGGEALAARDFYKRLTKTERDALLRFLGSL